MFCNCNFARPMFKDILRLLPNKQKKVLTTIAAQHGYNATLCDRIALLKRCVTILLDPKRLLCNLRDSKNYVAILRNQNVLQDDFDCNLIIIGVFHMKLGRKKSYKAVCQNCIHFRICVIKLFLSEFCSRKCF